MTARTRILGVDYGTVRIGLAVSDPDRKIAFPLTTGMSILGVQVVAAKWLFHEPIDVMQWTGTLLIGAGIFLVQR